jgi:hypothetical protein
VTVKKPSSLLFVKLLFNDTSGRLGESVTTGIMRITWLSLPLFCGPALSDSFNDFELLLRTTVSITLWAFWALILLSTLLPTPISLAIVRIGAPAAAALSVWSALETGGSVAGIIGLTVSAVAASVAISASLGDRFSDGASYGDERRFLLRAPGPVLLLFGPLAWLTSLAGLTLGPILLLNRNFLFGTLVTLGGLPLSVIASNAIYQLGKRWVVLVPAGILLHDHLSVGDPTLIPRNQIADFSPAKARTDALDLSQNSFGLSLEIRCVTPLSMMLKKGNRKTVNESSAVESFMINPARPNVVLAESHKRGL